MSSEAANKAEDKAALITVAEMAGRFGTSERALRRWLTLPQNAAKYAAQTQTVTRRTRTGERTAAAFPVALMSDIQADFEKQQADKAGQTEPGQKHGANGAQTQTKRGANPDTAQTAPRSFGADSERDTASELPPFMVALLAEKEARIADLTTALEAERDAHKRAELLHLNTQGELQTLRERAQLLESANAKLLQALPVANDAAQMPLDGPDTGANSESDTLHDASVRGVSDGPKRAWWKLWKREGRN